MKKLPQEDALLQTFLEVWSGRRTAKDAAQRLNISRKTYYEWEARALEGMRQSLKRGQPGRPRNVPDAHQAKLELENRQLRDQLEILQTRQEIRTLLVESMNSAQKK